MAAEQDDLARDAIVLLVKALNEGDLESVRHLLTEDAVLQIPSMGTKLVGRQSFTRRRQRRPAAWTDVEVEVVNLIACGGDYTLEAIVTGTHSGDWITGSHSFGTLAATGRRAARPACYVCAVRDGRIASLTAYYDRIALISELVR
jgi:ketosteroid isomerase-like protein